MSGQDEINPIDVENLYCIYTYTDHKFGSIIHSVPMLVTGEPDPMRLATFAGGTQVNLSNGKSIPIQFELKGNDLAEAIADFPRALKEYMDEFNSQMTQQRLLQGVPKNTKLDLSRLKS